MAGRWRAEPLTAQDWLWILLIAVIATIATAGSFLYFLPAYVISLFSGYVATQIFRSKFSRQPRWKFVCKVLAVVLPIFAILFAIELWLMGVSVRGAVES